MQTETNIWALKSVDVLSSWHFSAKLEAGKIL